MEPTNFQKFSNLMSQRASQLYYCDSIKVGVPYKNITLILFILYHYKFHSKYL